MSLITAISIIACTLHKANVTTDANRSLDFPLEAMAYKMYHFSAHHSSASIILQCPALHILNSQSMKAFNPGNLSGHLALVTHCRQIIVTFCDINKLNRLLSPGAHGRGSLPACRAYGVVTHSYSPVCVSIFLMCWTGTYVGAAI